jgi:hypothetical protein
MSDELEALVEALRRKTEYQSERIDELEETVAEMQELIDPDPGSTEYEQLTKAQKVRQIRVALLKEAQQNNRGVAQMKYKDVMWLFDGHPSAGHCYNLMERAADLDGFAYDQPGGSGGDKRVRVDSADVNDETLIHAVNNAVEG